ncbi:MAG: hypothetical protein COB66_04585 [Coxiella sp. (in: Bacteria)]|nr:MAG: hypothetical protein COB66_04585 [Coxiella sp. (in: g-proteobacteria)]
MGPYDSHELAEKGTGDKKPGLTDRFPFLKNKKLVIGVTAAMVVIVAFQVMKHDPKQNVVVKKQPVAAIKTVEQPANKMLNQLDSIKSDQVNNATTMSDMQNHISQLRSAVLTSNQANAQLNQSVSMLTAQVKLLTADVQKNTKSLTVTPKKKSVKPVFHPKPVTYTIKAVVRGRAWLMGSNGQSLSIAAGNTISNYYGKVRGIDADSGRVFTTSGKVIQYGSNDS